MRRSEKGQAIIETALVIPMLIVLAVGIAYFGFALHTYIVITNASREGARYASRFPDRVSEIQTVTQEEAANSGVDLVSAVASGVATIDVSAPSGTASGAPIRVTVTYKFSMPWLSGLFQLLKLPISEINLTGSTEMVIFGYD